MKNKYILTMAMLLTALTATAQKLITFDAEDYRSIGVYDQWPESPFRQGFLQGHAAVADNPDKGIDLVLGIAPNSTDKVVAVQRSRHAGNAFGVRINLKEPLRMTKEVQYIHIMAYLKDKPADSRMMVIGLGKRVESTWSWQTGEDEQFWAMTTAPVKPKAGWQDVVMSFKGFSYSKAENAESGIDIYSLVIVPDLRSPHADVSDWVAYFDEILVDGTPDKRFDTGRVDEGNLAEAACEEHGETVRVSASQLNGDIVMARNLSPLQNYPVAYAQPLTIKIIPAKGFVHNGFSLRYGRNVHAVERLDEQGKPNWNLITVPAKDIASDSTYTIPAECIRGGYVSIVGDMQQVRHYTVRVEGVPEGLGGVVYTGVLYGNEATIDASQYFSAEDVEAIPVEGYILKNIVLDTKSKVLSVTYKKALEYR